MGTLGEGARGMGGRSQRGRCEWASSRRQEYGQTNWTTRETFLPVSRSNRVWMSG